MLTVNLTVTSCPEAWTAPESTPHATTAATQIKRLVRREEFVFMLISNVGKKKFGLGELCRTEHKIESAELPHLEEGIT